MDNNNDIVVSPDELKADEEIQKGVTDDELKSKVAEEFGLNPETDTEMLDKLVAKEKSHHEKLSNAIKQKISWRTKVTASKPDEKGGSLKPEDVGNLVDQKVRETLENRDLESLSVSDEIKAEIKDLAKLKNISVRDASKLPYIVSKIEEAEKEERIKNGTPKRTNAGGKTIAIDPSKPLNSSDFDLGTDEGRKSWNEAKAERAKYRQDH
jgi:hypothetical protein